MNATPLKNPRWFLWPVRVLTALAVTVVGEVPGNEESAAADADSAVLRGFEKELASAYPAAAPSPSAKRSFTLRAAPTSIQFDGRTLAVWAYNAQVPGPTLRVRLGEEVEVRLTNDLPQPTTIHWHGVRVPNAMDGVPGVTQEPIPPGGSFTYRFVPKDPGTFWFHPHVRGAEQVERGLYGVLVVDDAEPLPYSRDEVWVLDDWRLGRDGEIDPQFVTRQDLAHDGRWGQVVTVNGDAAQSLKARPGERIRLRLVNTSNGRVYRPDFGPLAPEVIAVDGMYTRRPLAMTGFDLAPGNRLDLDLVIPADAAGRTFTVVDRLTRRPFSLATLRVEGPPVETPAFAAPANPGVPVWAAAVEQDVDVTYVLDAQLGGPYGIQWTINGRPWGEHEVTRLTEGRWVRIRFQNVSARLHPMHVHGQFFKVVARNGRPVDEPFLRDTVLLYGRETLDVGMVPIDWGRWMMHCHILEHAEAGMMTEIRVASLAAEIFGSGTISTEAPEFATSLTADGATLYFNRASEDRTELLILTSRRLADGSWSPPERVPFTGTYRDVDPFVSADGSRLFYSSNRSAPGEEELGDFDLWVVERTADGAWGEPRNLGAPVNSEATEIYSTLAENGNLYFNSDRGGESAVYCSRLVGERYAEPERLALGNGTESADGPSWGNPAIAPDESFLVLSSERPDGAGGTDLYVSFRRGCAWSEPRRLVEPVSSPYADFAPHVSWDGDWLYWTSERAGLLPAGAVEGRPPGDLYRIRLRDLDLDVPQAEEQTGCYRSVQQLPRTCL